MGWLFRSKGYTPTTTGIYVWWEVYACRNNFATGCSDSQKYLSGKIGIASKNVTKATAPEWVAWELDLSTNTYITIAAN